MLLLILALTMTQPDVSFTTLARGPMSQIDKPREVVVRTEAQWEALWKAHAPGVAAPRVDFAKLTVVGVFLGTRPSAGFEVEIVRIRRETDGLMVEYATRKPGPGAIAAQVLTAPFQLVTLSGEDGTIRFRPIGAR
jgi:hypothetical protein